MRLLESTYLKRKHTLEPYTKFWLVEIICLAFAEVANEVTKVSFGEYSGSYEGDISTFVPTMGNAKQRSSQLGHTHQLTPELRRYSHLKLMISYIMGSGAIAGEFLKWFWILNNLDP